jgi:hypothetical protein
VKRVKVVVGRCGASRAVLSYRCATISHMAVRKKRSISMPPELDAAIEAAAAEAGMTYSAWLANTARKEFAVGAGLAAVAEYERRHGAFTTEELEEAGKWAQSAVSRSKRSGSRQRRSA